MNAWSIEKGAAFYLKMNFNFNISRIRFRAGAGQRTASRIAVICITRRNGALNGVSFLYHTQELTSLLQFRKQFLFGAEFVRMHTAAAAAEFDWVF